MRRLEKTKLKCLKFLATLSVASVPVFLNFQWFSPQTFWLSLLVLSIACCLLSWKISWKDKGKIKAGLICGVLLAAIDLAMNYQGMIFELYLITPTAFTILADPIELPLIAFFGGACLSTFLPRKPNLLHLVLAVLLISFVGATVEVFLNKWGIMTYYGVGYLDAFFTYALVFSAFFAFNYLLLKKFKK